MPYTLVPGSQAKVNVNFLWTSDPGPYPIPDNVSIQKESDHHALIVDTDHCILYEFFALSRAGDGSWQADAGAIYPLNSNQLRPQGWTSADAAGLPILPGLVRYEEVVSGHIDHAIRFTAQQTRDTHIWPARHDASSLSGGRFPQMGQRFRLKQDFDISPFPRNVQVILQALKTYGMILADNGTSFHIAGIGDPRFNDDEMHQMTRVVGADFEAVDESGLIVDVDSGQAQSNSLPSTGGAPTGWVNVISKNSGKCLSLPGGSSDDAAGSPLQQWTCQGSTSQEFEFTGVPNGYKVSVRSSSMQMDVAGGPPAVWNGVNIIQFPYWGGSNEIWNLTDMGNGYFTLKPRNSGLCLDVAGISQADGARIQQYSCNGGDNQKWSFTPAN